MNIAFAGIMALGLKDKSPPIPELPDRTFRRQIGNWHVEVCSDDYQAKVTWCGWPAGIITPNGGVIAAGECANEDTFIEAIEAELGCGVEEYLAAQPA